MTSDAVKFQHHYLPRITLTTEDKIIHALQAMNATIMANKLGGPSEDQLHAIQALRDIVDQYRPQPRATVQPPQHVIPADPGMPPLPGVQAETNTPPCKAQ